jgi:hypothetical protein
MEFLCFHIWRIIKQLCLHIDLIFALSLIYLFCANGVVNKNGHVIDDVVLYHTHICCLEFTCEGTYAYSSTPTKHELTKGALESYFRMCTNECFAPHTSTTHDLSVRAHLHLDKVTCFYLRNHANMFEHWLIFECYFAFVVNFTGFTEGEGSLMSHQAIPIKDDHMVNTKYKPIYLPHLHDDRELSFWMTLFEVGEMMQPNLRSSPHHVHDQQYTHQPITQRWIFSFMYAYEYLSWMENYFVIHHVSMLWSHRQVRREGWMPWRLGD